MTRQRGEVHGTARGWRDYAEHRDRAYDELRAKYEELDTAVRGP